MKKISALLIASLFVFSSAGAVDLVSNPTITTTVTTGPVFTRSLGVGTIGRDVLALKKILKLEVGISDTLNAYNSLTASGVTKLQEKYAVDILIPNGLSAGTGFVGPSTIKKLNALAIQYNVKLSDFANVDIVTRQTFTLTLSLGSVNSEVALLKNILNSQVAAGLDSTNVYDAATAAAVSRFQEKYAAEILVPNGLTAGTGIVGSSTRKKLNSLLQTSLAVGGTTGTQTGSTGLTTSGSFSGGFSSTVGQNFGTYTSGVSGVTLNTTDGSVALCDVLTDTVDRINAGCGTSFAQYNAVTTKTITGFSFTGITTEASIDIINHTVTVFLPPVNVYNESVDQQKAYVHYPFFVGGLSYNLGTPNITFTGASISPKPGVPVPTNPANYTVTAKDGSTEVYKVTLKPATCPDFTRRIPLNLARIGKVQDVVRMSGFGTLFGDGGTFSGIVQITDPGTSQLQHNVGAFFSDKYKLAFISVPAKANTPEQRMIDRYCNLPAWKEFGILFNTSDDVREGAYFNGEVEAPLVKVDTCHSFIEFGTGCPDWGRVKVSGGLSL